MKKIFSILLALLLLFALPAQAVPARLNQRMATRSGPSTLYTEELGTLPKDTPITVIEQVMGSVPWGLVEFEKRGLLYRAYTGMKRIDAYGPVPWGIQEGTFTYMSRNAQVYYGPGEHYAPRQESLYAGQSVLTFGWENGFVMVEYPLGDKKVRGYVRDTAVQGYGASHTSPTAPLTAAITLSNQIPFPGENLLVTFHISGGVPPYEYSYIFGDHIDYEGSGRGASAQVYYPVVVGMRPAQHIYLWAEDASGAETQQEATFYPAQAQAEEVVFEAARTNLSVGDTAQVTVLAQFSPNVYMGYLGYEFRWAFEAKGGGTTYTPLVHITKQRSLTVDYKATAPGRLWLECRVYDPGDNFVTYRSPIITVK